MSAATTECEQLEIQLQQQQQELQKNNITLSKLLCQRLQLHVILNFEYINYNNNCSKHHQQIIYEIMTTTNIIINPSGAYVSAASTTCEQLEIPLQQH